MVTQVGKVSKRTPSRRRTGPCEKPWLRPVTKCTLGKNLGNSDLYMWPIIILKILFVQNYAN